MTWLPEVVDYARFATAEQVAAYCGCDPSLKVSAGKVTDFVRRKGNLRLHKALLYAASSEMRKADSKLAQWGAAIAGRHRKGGYRKATGAMARRLACSLWHVQRLGAPYDPSKYLLAKTPIVRDAPAAAIGLTPRQLSLLPPGLKTAQSLVDAFWRGEFASVRGFGDAGNKRISDWIQANRAVRAGPKQYLLNKNLNYEASNKRRAATPGGDSGKEKKGVPLGGQDAVLHNHIRKGRKRDLPSGQVV